MNVPDWLYERLPERMQDWLYERAFYQEIRSKVEAHYDDPKQAQWHGDAKASANLQQQQQQTRDWVGEMVKRMEEIEREQPKERRQERGEERER